MSKIDYRTLLDKNGAKDDKTLDRRWWLASKTDMPKAIESVCTSLYNQSQRRQTQTITSARLYGNLSMIGAAGLSYSKIASVQSSIKDRITYNVCQSTVDTVTAKIAKNKPKPYFLTSDGDYKMKKKAQKLGKFIDGCFYENEIYKLGVDIFRDAAVWGTGVIYVYSENNVIKAERALMSEIYVDEVEAVYGKPRQMHRVRNIDRQVLMEAYPKSKAEIMIAQLAKSDNSAYENVADQVTVVESWHLVSGPNAKDGLHVISIPTKILASEIYEQTSFPFAFFHWTKRLYGFYGQGLIEQIQNIQAEINKLLWVIQRSMHLAGSFKIWMKSGSKIPKEHFNNEIGTILMGEEAPQYLVPPIVAPEVYAHLMTLKNAAYEQAGVSQLSAAAKKPDGLDSGKALREYNDIESDRFMTVGQSFEQLFLDIAGLMVIEAKKIYDVIGFKKLKVKVPGKKFIETINWKDVNMDNDHYIMQMFPVSKLPDEPAGRLQTVQELLQAGLITPQSGRRLLDYPDLESEESLANSEEELLHKMLDAIVEDSDYSPPEPTDNLQLAEKLTLEYINRGRKDNLEDHKLDLLRIFLDQIHLLMVKASQPDNTPGQQPQLPIQPGAMPPANPAAPPTSDLLQNTNSPMPQAA